MLYYFFSFLSKIMLLITTNRINGINIINNKIGIPIFAKPSANKNTYHSYC